MARAGYKPVIEYCGGTLESPPKERCFSLGMQPRAVPQRLLVALTHCTILAPAHQPTLHRTTLPCAGTELGGAYFSGSPLQPQSPSTFSTPTVGHRPVILCSPAQPEGSLTLSPHGDTQREHHGEGRRRRIVPLAQRQAEFC